MSAMRASYSQGELSDAFSGTNTPNGSYVSPPATGDNISFGTLNMMEKLKVTNDKDDMDWSAIDRDIREEVGQVTEGPNPASMAMKVSVGGTSPGGMVASTTSPEVQVSGDVTFYPYPILPQDPLGQQSSRNQPEDPSLVKLFMGNMRFEMTRSVVAWVIGRACNGEIDPSRVLIHYKSCNGTPTATGCASVFLNQSDAQALLEFNQRIFCGANGIFVALTSGTMKNLLRERKILDVGPDGRVKGPRHAVVVEISRATTPNSSFSSSNSNSMVAAYRPAARMSPPPHHLSPTSSAPAPIYHQYPGPPTEAQDPPAPIANPTEFFVGGICYEATPDFVAWMLTLCGAKVHFGNVTLFEDNKTGGKRGCAMVKVEPNDFPTIRAFHHRLLCDAKGVYVADTTQGIPTFLKQQKAAGEVMRGPSHAVVIEKRRAQATPPPSYTTASDMPPPPPYVPGGGVGNWNFPMAMPSSGLGAMAMPFVPASQGGGGTVPVLAPAQLSPGGVQRTPPANGSLSPPPTTASTIRLDSGSNSGNGRAPPQPSWKVASTHGE